MGEEFENDGPYQDAQSAEELERYVMGSTFPKTPAEWWACREIDRLRARIAELEAALREAYEVYAGSDGFIPETAAEGYQQQLIKQMVEIIGAALAKENTDLRAARAAYLGEKK